MRYDFQHVETGLVREVVIPHEAIAAFTEEAESRGWVRVWNTPHITVVPGYFEAKAEADRIADDPWSGNPRMSFEKMMDVT